VVSYKLKEPVKFGDKEITEVNLRKPKMGDLKGLSLNNLGTEQFGILFGRLSEHSTVVFEMLSWEDGFAVAELLGDFLPSTLKTGKS